MNERVKVMCKVSVYLEAPIGASMETLKDAWRKHVKEGKFKTGNFSMKTLEYGEETDG